MLMVLSSEALARRVPSAEKTTARTGPPWPRKTPADGPAINVPQDDVTIAAGGSNQLAVRRDGDATHSSFVFRVGTEFHSSLRHPTV